MLSPTVAATEDFARLFFRLIEKAGSNGEWMSQSEMFRRTVASSVGHPYVTYILAKPGGRIGFTAIAERIRRTEFPHVARRKMAFRRNAPVHFRLRTEARALVPAAAHDVIGIARSGPDLALLDRALAQERDADLVASTLTRSGSQSAFQQACRAFDWHQPSWLERLTALLGHVRAQLSALWSRRFRTPSTAA